MTDSRAAAPASLPADSLPPGAVRRAGAWTVVHVPGSEPRAVSSRCRHQLADLSKGTIDADGCLVCPWHASKYDVTDGRMVEGPKGFLGYRGKTPGYTQLVLAYGKALKLKTRAVLRRGDDLVVEE